MWSRRRSGPQPTLSLLSWVKNETDATATALDGYTLDQTGSTTYLWDEIQTAFSAGSYSGDFQYSSSIGWQTAVVGLKPATVGSQQFALNDFEIDEPPPNAYWLYRRRSARHRSRSKSTHAKCAHL
jgi:hypothetical protein